MKAVPHDRTERAETAVTASPRPATRWHVKLFLTLAALTWAVGTWQSTAPQQLAWWKVTPGRDILALYQPLRRHLAGAARVDYLMDRPPASPGTQKIGAGSRKQSEGTRFFRAQYVLAPVLVHQVYGLSQVRKRAERSEVYYLLFDPSFHSSLHDVLGVLSPIARQRQQNLAVHRTPKGLAVIVLGGSPP